MPITHVRTANKMHNLFFFRVRHALVKRTIVKLLQDCGWHSFSISSVSMGVTYGFLMHSGGSLAVLKPAKIAMIAYRIVAAATIILLRRHKERSSVTDLYLKRLRNRNSQTFIWWEESFWNCLWSYSSTRLHAGFPATKMSP